MSYNTKNYTEQGGDKTVIGGELAIEGDGMFTFNGTELKPAAIQDDSIAADTAALVTDFNALIAKLKTAGLMESE